MKVLLVEDEPKVASFIKKGLEEQSYEVDQAYDGNFGLKMALQNEYDLIILDIILPNMNGLEVCQAIRKKKTQVPILMLTALGSTDDKISGLDAGADDYLTKPFDLSTMRAAVASAMERHSLSEEIRANNRRLAALQEELHNQKLQEEIIRTKGEIYASIIHDINGPLTIISGFIEIINQHISNATSIEGGNLEVEVRDQREVIVDSFPIFRDVVIPPGDYRFRDLSLSYRSSEARRLTGSVSLSAGRFWGGTRRSVRLGGTWRPRHNLFLELSTSRDDVDLPEGAFLADLASARVRFAASTALFGSAFVQYNAETDQLVSNLRLDFRHAPLSDVFLVLVDRRHVPTGVTLERSVALKVTRLLAF